MNWNYENVSVYGYHNCFTYKDKGDSNIQSWFLYPTSWQIFQSKIGMLILQMNRKFQLHISHQILMRLALFGTMEDDSLLINTITSSNCLCHRKIFQNSVSTFSKMVNHFLASISKFCLFFAIRYLFKVHQNVVQILIK